MANFILIFVCLGLGFALKRLKTLPAETPAVLNAVITQVSLPALTLLHMHSVLSRGRLDSGFLAAAGMAWVVFGLAALIFKAFAGPLQLKSGTLGALILTGGLGNTSFVGFPLLIALIGPKSLEVGIIADQAGSFLVLSTIGVFTAAKMSSSGASLLPSEWGFKILRFPPFLALLLAGALAGWEYPPALSDVLDHLASTLIPLALISVGFQLHMDHQVLRRRWRLLALGLSYKLILAPALILVFYQLGRGPLTQESLQVLKVLVLEAGMAPMITAAIVAGDYGLDSELAGLMIGVGIPLSLITVPGWHWLLQRILE